MNRLYYPRNRISPSIVTAIALGIHILMFARFYDLSRPAVALLAILPVISGSWFFGTAGGVLMAIITSLSSILILGLSSSSLQPAFANPSNIIGTMILMLIAYVIGTIRSVSHDRGAALARLGALEHERQQYIDFLESLNEITRTALEAQDLQSTLKVLVERIAKLFRADDAFIDFWDDGARLTTPAIAFGSIGESYPRTSFRPGDPTLTAMVMDAEEPLAIEDMRASAVNPDIAARLPSLAMLGIPLIVQGNKIASFFLGYDRVRQFEPAEITNAEIAAQQIALVLTKTKLLEEAHKQLEQLKVLHEVAVVSTQAETVDQLIERTTEIIGKNLFPDNFGVLLMDEERDVLRVHPSYRFGTGDVAVPTEVQLGQGITGHVAETGLPVRVRNVAEAQNYLDIDTGTASELCVPIRLKGRVLGVINAESSRVDAFSTDDELLLGTLAGQLAIAIEQLHAAAAERRWLDQLARSNELIYALAHITTHVEKALSPDEITQALGRELKQLGLTCALAVYDNTRKSFRFNYTSLKSEYLLRLEGRVGLRLARHAFSLDKGRLDSNLQQLFQPAVISNPEEEMRAIFGQDQSDDSTKILDGIGYDMDFEVIRLPLMFEQNLLGILWVWGKDLTRADLPVLSIFAKQIGISLERARLFQEVQNLAATDSLTGLHNRRSLFEVGRLEFARSQRLNRPFCCMMLDLDHFKQINDTYGHILGDHVLREFAQRCKRSVREIDLIGRYGGEELMILLPDTELNTALQVAERLREAVAETPIHASYENLQVTVSIGVATKDENTLELETLIARADQAMYIAKYKGRNQVAVSR